MDLGITDRKAIVCASSRGLGKGCAKHLAQAGCQVIVNGRNHDVTMATAAAKGISVEEAASNEANAIPAKRFGTADKFGALCAFLCSQQAGYITGRNILVDGGLNQNAF